MSDVTYQSAWATLSAIDVSKHVEKKNGLSYLSWAWAWGVLMEHFPQATYEFSDLEIHDDRSVTVHCCVSLAPDVSRSMWLPVMDYKNNAIINPDARKISDTKMRCLVKALAMFGLGHYIYAGEDTPQKEEQVEAKEPPKKNPPKKKEPTTTNERAEIPTEEAAEDVVKKLIEFAQEFCEDLPALRAFWGDNKKIIDILDSHYPAQFEKLKTAFTTLKESIGENNES